MLKMQKDILIRKESPGKNICVLAEPETAMTSWCGKGELSHGSVQTEIQAFSLHIMKSDTVLYLVVRGGLHWNFIP